MAFKPVTSEQKQITHTFAAKLSYLWDKNLMAYGFKMTKKIHFIGGWGICIG